MDTEGSLTIRTDLRPGDLGAIVHMHGIVYARECGFDHTFEAYVAEPLAQFARRADRRERLWIAESGGCMVGSIAIVAAASDTAQLRWFLVAPEWRGKGLGRRLLQEAVAFCQSSGYGSVILWTVSALVAASRIYNGAGFRKIEEKPGRQWSVDVTEEKYELKFRGQASH